ncbi:MAG: ParB/RepB/Spo0J family partition protein [Planctomycetota bacterium]
MNRASETGWLDVRLDRLEDHPANSNVMPHDAYAKLKAHLAGSDRYPPLIVRRLSRDKQTDRPERRCDERFQLLDGHHRAKALRELGRATARCDVWAVDEDEALVLLATLNRLRGRDDPRKRAALLHDLAQRFERKALLARLPESSEKLKRLTAMHETKPALCPPQRLADMPVATHFFLRPADKRTLDAALRLAIAGGVGSREAALLAWAEAALSAKPDAAARTGGD